MGKYLTSSHADWHSEIYEKEQRGTYFSVLHDLHVQDICTFTEDVFLWYMFIECSHRLGMIGGEISYKQLKPSSSAAYGEPRYGRINMALGYGAWCPAIQDQSQYLQVKTNNK